MSLMLEAACFYLGEWDSHRMALKMSHCLAVVFHQQVSQISAEAVPDQDALDGQIFPVGGRV